MRVYVRKCLMAILIAVPLAASGIHLFLLWQEHKDHLETWDRHLDAGKSLPKPQYGAFDPSTRFQVSSAFACAFLLILLVAVLWTDDKIIERLAVLISWIAAATLFAVALYF